ncbi:YdgA family protein [Basfia succiniciproducens]|uniref:YdgA family protein n=1 Tax=Basfia succiniciproducens TaxID=653940 RepID=UPI003FCD7E99
MNKSKLALIIIVALGAVWTGGAWFTGKTAEAEYKTQVENLNKQLTSAKSAVAFSVKIENVRFDRGLFSSEMSYDILIESTQDKTQTWRLPFAGTLYHGPLPLNLVRQFDFSPAVFSSHSQLIKNELTTPWFDYTKEQNPITADISLNYMQEFDAALNLAAGDIKLEDIAVNWSNAFIKYAATPKKQGEFNYRYDAAKLTLTDKALADIKLADKAETQSDLSAIDIELQNLDGLMQIIPATNDITTGLYKGKIENLTYTYHFADNKKTANTIYFNNFNYDYAANENEGMLNYDIHNRADSLKINDKNLGGVQLDLQANHLPTNLVAQLIHGIKRQADEKEINEILLKILENQPHFRISPLALQNTAGKFTGNFNIELAHADFANALKKGNVLSLFKQFSLNIDTDKPALVEFLSTLQQLSGVAKEKADGYAQQQVDQIANTLKKQNVIVEEGGSAKFNLAIVNDKLMLNGNEIPEEYIGLMLFGLMMQSK